MESSNPHAFKEWAVVCAALASGEQSLILRKGGIHEGRDGFRVSHPEFWLYPTAFHQAPDVLKPGMETRLQQFQQGGSIGEIAVRQYAVVDKVIEIKDESVLKRLEAFHIWSESAIHQRYHYKSPGLFALIVRVFQLPAVIAIPESPIYAGCRSWVQFPHDLSTSDLVPVLSDKDHSNRLASINAVF